MILGILALLAASDVPPATPPAPKPKPKLVCREGGDAQVGSHMRTNRRCLTEEQWQQEDARRDAIPLTARVSADSDDAARDAKRPH
jgi:hypothetical protein